MEALWDVEMVILVVVAGAILAPALSPLSPFSPPTSSLWLLLIALGMLNGEAGRGLHLCLARGDIKRTESLSVFHVINW